MNELVILSPHYNFNGNLVTIPQLFFLTTECLNDLIAAQQRKYNCQVCKRLRNRIASRTRPRQVFRTSCNRRCCVSMDVTRSLFDSLECLSNRRFFVCCANFRKERLARRSDTIPEKNCDKQTNLFLSKFCIN